MRRFLVVGCGGSGGNTLAYLMDQLRSDLADAGIDHLPAGWQFVHVDVPTGEDRGPEGLPNVQQERGRYAGIGPTGGSYPVLDKALTGSLLGGNALGEIGTWAPRDPDSVGVPLSTGAGQARALGRLVTLSKASAINEILTSSWNRLHAVDVAQEFHRIADAAPNMGSFDPATPPVVLVVGSMAGGSGASMTLDVCRILSQIQNLNPGLMGIFMVGADVFDSLPAAARSGVRPNALAMFGEIVASQVGAARRHDVTTLGALGLNAGEGERVPFARVFPIGRFMGTERIPFGTGSPAEIYRALGRGLAGLMASGVATQQFVDYDLTNVTEAGGQQHVGWGLTTEEWNWLPWAGFGFASLSMGRDRYAEYAAQRIARAAVDRLLYGHLQPGNTAGPEDQLNGLLDNQWTIATRALGLPDLSTVPPQDLETQVGRWWATTPYPSDEAYQASWQTMEHILGPILLPPSPQLAPQEWLTATRKDLSDRTGAMMQSLGQVATRWAYGWQQRLLEQLKNHLVQAISQHGLAYSIRLLQRVGRQLTDLSGLLPRAVQGWSRPELLAISPELVALLPTGRNARMVGGDRVIEQLKQELNRWLGGYLWGRAADLGVKVMADIAQDVLPTLTAALTEAQRVLEQGVAESAGSLGLARVATDKISAWPREADEKVDSRFDHAVNEVLLTTSAEYRQAFQSHIVASLPSDRPGQGVIASLQMVSASVIEGQWQTTGSDLAPGGLLVQGHPWRSKVFSTDPSTGDSLVPTLPTFDVTVGPEHLLKRARLYVGRPGEAFAKFSALSLRDYVAGTDAAPSEAQQRKQSVVGDFRRAVNLALPLVGVNDAAVQAIHGKPVDYRFKFSRVPFAELDVSNALEDVILNDSRIDNSTRDFFRASLNTDVGVRRIDIFGSYQNYSPVVFDSVLTPVDQQWSQTPPHGRLGFWQWRRTRPLPASLPMSEVERRTMVAGYLLAQITGLIRIPIEDPAGHPVRILDRTTGEWVQFPFPLLTPPDTFAAPYDWLPALLESSLIAVARSHQPPVFSSLRPYQLLRAVYDDSPNRPAGGIVRPSASRLIPEFLSQGQLPMAAASRVPGIAEATTIGERAELTRTWLTQIGDLAGVHFLPAGTRGAVGGGTFSIIGSRAKAAQTPIFRDVAEDVFWAVARLQELVDQGERDADQQVLPTAQPTYADSPNRRNDVTEIPMGPAF